MTKKIFKINSKLDPEPLLEKLNKSIKRNDDGVVSFEGIGYHEIIPILANIFYHDRHLPDIDIDEYLEKAIFEIAKKDLKIESNTLLDKLNEKAKETLSSKEKVYILLSSVSIFKGTNLNSVDLDGTTIKFSPTYPDIFLNSKSSSELITKNNETENYLKIIAKTKAKTPNGAFSKIMDTIDFWRGSFNFFVNPGMEIVSDTRQPINRVRLGQYHSLYLKGSFWENIDNWSEDNFMARRVVQTNLIQRHNSNAMELINNVKEHPDSGLLISAISRYARALDERKANISVIRLWSIVELLLGDKDSKSYDKIVKRLNFLFLGDQFYHRMIENIRDYRNKNVHDGIGNSYARAYAYQLQFVVLKLIKFYLKVNLKITEANQILDCPTDYNAINNKMKIYGQALEFSKILLS